MAIGRISGQMLKSNLLRSGTDLAFETDLLVLDVTNSRVGVGTASPSTTFEVSGTGTFTNVSTSGNITVGGNLTVNGTTTTVATTNTTIADNIIELNSGISASSNDAGLLIERGSTGDNAFIGWDESADKFTVGTTTATAGDKSGGITVSTGTLVANLEGDVTGDVTGTVSDISNHLLDEDNMASNSATKAPSQQSVKAYVDAEDANIASDTLTFTNKTFDANGTGNSLSNVEVADMAASAVITVAETLASNDSDTAFVTAGAIIDYVDAQDANIASDTLTFTNKTFDANGTGNSISNIEVADLASGVLDTDLSSVSASDDTLASAKAIKAYVDSEVSAVSTNAISQGNSSATVTDTGSDGTFTVVADGNTELTINDTQASFSGNVTVAGDLTVNGTTTTVATTNTTIADNIIELNSGISASGNDAGIIIERGSTGDNAFIGWDESADKFTVGTTTATAGDKSGGITVTTGTLVANLEGNVTGNVTAGNIQVGVTGDNEIDTSSGNLTLDSAGGTVTVDDDLTVNGTTTANTLQTNVISSADSTAVRIDDALNVDGALDVGAGLTLSNGTSVTSILDEDAMGSDSATALATQQSIKAYVDAQDANIASDTLTFTNKTFDANGTGNSISNIETADFASAAFKDEDNMASDSDTAVASQQSIKAYVDAEDANIASDTLTFTNKTFDANGTGNSISNIEVADMAAAAVITVAETLASNDSDTAFVTAGAIIDYVDAQDANIASDTLTFTNKTFDANGTGNSLSNVEVADFASGVVDTDLSSVSASDDTLASAKAIKAYVDSEVSSFSSNSISQGNSSATVTDTGSDGAFTVVADGNTELVINDTSATFSGNVIVSGDMTVNGTTTTIDSQTLTIEDPLIQLAKNNSGGDANVFDQGLFFNRGSLDNVSFIWDESADQFAFAVTSGEDGTTAGNITIDSYANLKAGVATVTDIETGTISAADGTQSATIANSTGVMTIASSVLTTTDINGGSIDGVTIGSNSAATALVANGGINIDDDGDGAMDGVVIGANTAAAGTFTTATATNLQATNIKANDGTAAIVITDSTGAVAVSTAFTATGNVSVNGGTFIFNEAGADLDFRFEGDTDQNLLFGDAGNDRIGIGTATPGYDLDIGTKTGAVLLPQGNTAARPTAATGVIRFNTQTGKYEGSEDGSTWSNFAIAGDTPIFSKLSATGDGSTTTFTSFFSTAPASANNVFVYIDNVYQEPTENYSVSSTNITFTSAPHSGARIFAITGADGTELSLGNRTTLTDGDTSVTVGDNDDSTSAITFTVDGVQIGQVLGDGITLAAGKEFNGTATAAQYSDVAERFHADAWMEPGTVVKLGGVNEITAVAEEASDDVFGVVSGTHQAAFKMNGGAGPDETHPYIAMTGRVDVKVIGTVNKGDRLVASSTPGIARAATKAECTAFNVIGRALSSKTSTGLGSVLAAVRVSH